MKLANFALVFVAAIQLHAIPWTFPEKILTKDNPSTPLVSKIDSRGNAFAVWIGGQGSPQFAIYNALQQAWGESGSLDEKSPANMAVAPALCISEEGKAIVFWVRGSNLVARIHSGGEWEPSLREEPYLLSSGGVVGISEIYADMNRKGEAAVIWSETRANPFRDVAVMRRYVSGSWVPELSKPAYALCDDGYTDTIDVFPSVRINEAGDLAAAWKFNGIVVARQFYGRSQSWVPSLENPPIALSGSRGRFPRVAIDAAGDLYAAWIREEMVEATKVIKGMVQTTATLGMATHALDLAAAPDGTVLAVWPSLGEMVFGSVFFRNSWSVPMMISQIGAAHPSVGIDEQGNGTAVWENHATGTVQMAELYRGVWQTPTDLFPIGNEPRFARVALSRSGNTLVSWKTNEGTGEVAICLKNPVSSSSMEPVVSPPLTLATLGEPPSFSSSVAGKKVRNNFGFVSEIFHEISWEPCVDPNVVGYQLFVNNALIKECSHCETRFRVHNKANADSVMYHVRAINAKGLQSHPLPVQPADLEEEALDSKSEKRNSRGGR